jgi:haloalkane dehalogenase
LLAFDPDGELRPSLTGSAAAIAWARANVVGLEVIDLGSAGHHAPEDVPREIRMDIIAWLERQRRAGR